MYMLKYNNRTHNYSNSFVAVLFISLITMCFGITTVRSINSLKLVISYNELVIEIADTCMSAKYSSVVVLTSINHCNLLLTSTSGWD